MALNVLGFAKAKFTDFPVIKSILETLLIGVISAGGAYGLGALVNSIVGE